MENLSNEEKMTILFQQVKNCTVTETTTELSPTTSDISIQTTSSIEVTTTSIWTKSGEKFTTEPIKDTTTSNWFDTDTTSDSTYPFTETLPTSFTSTKMSTISDETLFFGNLIIVIDKYETTTESKTLKLPFETMEELQLTYTTIGPNNRWPKTSEATTKPHFKLDNELPFEFYRNCKLSNNSVLHK